MKPLTREQAAAILLVQEGVDPTPEAVADLLRYIDQRTAERKAQRPK